MSAPKNARDKTRVVHAGLDRDPFTGASSIPIYQVSTYHQEDPLHLGPRDYGRGDNPTREAMENAVAELEGGERGFGFGFASGVAAIASTLMALLKAGDHIIVSTDVYGGTYRMLTTFLKDWGLETTFTDLTEPENIVRALKSNTRAVFAETPSNPTLRITDLRAVATLAKSHGLYALVDNTFMTPYLQKPLELGFDVSIHSATKFLGGHSDLIAGVAVTAEEETGHRIRRIQNGFGAVLGPQDSYLVLRGIRTLGARLEAQQAGALKVAQWLAGRPEVRAVNYPGLPSHPGHATHAAQATGPGAVLSFELADGDAAVAFLRAVKLSLVAVSLGGVESILSYPRTMSHASLPAEERKARGISDGLIRLSVGLEAPEDLIEDMEGALAATRRLG